jgi:hypothetical protein
MWGPDLVACDTAQIGIGAAASDDISASTVRVLQEEWIYFCEKGTELLCSLIIKMNFIFQRLNRFLLLNVTCMGRIYEAAS